jgi:tetratricopeptide (TPR) repeat protein
MDIFFITSIIAPLIVYALTLEPTVFWVDSGVYLATIKDFGIAFAPGFPLYILLAKLWSFLPFKSFAWRVNFLSAIFAALACGFLYLAIRKILGSLNKEVASLNIKIISLACSISFGFSYSHWSQAINAEVYSFTVLFTVIIVYLFSLWEGKGDKRLVLMLALFYGLSFANHPIAIGLLPAYVYFAWINRNVPLAADKKFIFKAGVVFFLSGFLPYLYMPLRSIQNPVMDWGNPENLSNFINHVTARSSLGEMGNWVFLNRELFEKFITALKLSLRQFTPFGFILFIFGSFYFLKIKTKLSRLLLIIYLASLLLGIVYKTAEFGSWFITSYVVMSIWIAVGIFSIIPSNNGGKIIPKAGLFLRLRRLAVTKSATAFICCALVLPILWINYPVLNRSKNFYAEDYARNLIKNLPPKSILLLTRHLAESTAFYVQLVLGEARDTHIIQLTQLHHRWYRENLIRYLGAEGTLPKWRCREENNAEELSACSRDYLREFINSNIDKFSIFELLPNEVSGYSLIPAGIGYKLSKDLKEEINPKYWDFYFHDEDFSQPRDIQEIYNSSWEVMLRGYIGAYKNLGDWYLWKKGAYDNAAIFYGKALKLVDIYSGFNRFDSVMHSNILELQGIAFARANKLDLALVNFDSSLEKNPFNILAYVNKGMIYERQKRTGAALELYKRALQIDPGNKEASDLVERLKQAEIK